MIEKKHNMRFQINVSLHCEPVFALHICRMKAENGQVPDCYNHKDINCGTSFPPFFLFCM